MKTRCRIGWHDWSAWSELTEKDATLTYGTDPTPTHIEILTQNRHCPDCKLVQRHIQTVDPRP